MTRPDVTSDSPGDPAADAVDVVIPGAFDAFYTWEFPRLVDLAYALSGSRLAAEDLAQDAMVTAHRQWDRIGQLDRPGAWVRRVVLNNAASLYHRRRAELRAIARLAPLRGAPPAALDSEFDHVWRAVRRLPRRQAQAVALFYLAELTIAECAQEMQCAENTVKAHLHQARRSLARRLRLEGEDQ